jgi:hypothetical protein
VRLLMMTRARRVTQSSPLHPLGACVFKTPRVIQVFAFILIHNIMQRVRVIIFSVELHSPLLFVHQPLFCTLGRPAHNCHQRSRVITPLCHSDATDDHENNKTRVATDFLLLALSTRIVTTAHCIAAPEQQLKGHPNSIMVCL